jgi:hypothetical protein
MLGRPIARLSPESGKIDNWVLASTPFIKHIRLRDIPIHILFID